MSHELAIRMALGARFFCFVKCPLPNYGQTVEAISPNSPWKTSESLRAPSGSTARRFLVVYTSSPLRFSWRLRPTERVGGNASPCCQAPAKALLASSKRVNTSGRRSVNVIWPFVFRSVQYSPVMVFGRLAGAVRLQKQSTQMYFAALSPQMRFWLVGVDACHPVPHFASRWGDAFRDKPGF